MFDSRTLVSENLEKFFRYNINHQTPDSAATATAYLCGVKAQLGTIGVDGRAKRANCSSSIGANVSSVLDWAQKAGKLSSMFD
jgi:alkaline phosphatase